MKAIKFFKVNKIPAIKKNFKSSMPIA